MPTISPPSGFSDNNTLKVALALDYMRTSLAEDSQEALDLLHWLCDTDPSISQLSVLTYNQLGTIVKSIKLYNSTLDAYDSHYLFPVLHEVSTLYHKHPSSTTKHLGGYFRYVEPYMSDATKIINFGRCR